MGLENYNGIEYNAYLQKQITASVFWNKLFLNPSNYSKLCKYGTRYTYLKYEFQNNDIFINEYKNTKNPETKTDIIVTDEEKLQQETE